MEESCQLSYICSICSACVCAVVKERNPTALASLEGTNYLDLIFALDENQKEKENNNCPDSKQITKGDILLLYRIVLVQVKTE